MTRLEDATPTTVQPTRYTDGAPLHRYEYDPDGTTADLAHIIDDIASYALRVNRADSLRSIEEIFVLAERALVRGRDIVEKRRVLLLGAGFEFD